jgi:hypothetical protein
MGDGILVYFGYPRAHEDEPERSVRAGLDIVDAMAELNAAFPRPSGVEIGRCGGELMLLQRRLAALFAVLALTGCAPVAVGPDQVPNAPYQQNDTRDTSGMR